MINISFTNQSTSLPIQQYSPPHYRYGIVKDEPYRGIVASIMRMLGFDISYYPNTVPMQDQSGKSGKGAEIMIGWSQWPFIRNINSDRGWKWARSVGVMMINKDYFPDTPEEKLATSESITCGRSFFASDYQTDTHVHLVSYRGNLTSLDATIHNWDLMPWMIFKANAIAPNSTKIIKPAGGNDVFWPRIARTELWLPKTAVEMFPTPPVGIDYELRGTDVMGVNNDQLIPIATENGGVWKFHTSWFRLSTLPNLPMN